MGKLLSQLREYFENTPKEVLEKEAKELEYLNEIGPDVLEYAKAVRGYINKDYNKYIMILTKKEYVKKELDKLNLKPSKREIVLRRIDFTITITELNKIISEYKKDYSNNEIMIDPSYDYDMENCTISINVIVDETEEDFNIRLKCITSRIEDNYDRLIKLLQV